MKTEPNLSDSYRQAIIKVDLQNFSNNNKNLFSIKQVQRLDVLAFYIVLGGQKQLIDCMNGSELAISIG
jgi:hypothetical protein